MKKIIISSVIFLGSVFITLSPAPASAATCTPRTYTECEQGNPTACLSVVGKGHVAQVTQDSACAYTCKDLGPCTSTSTTPAPTAPAVNSTTCPANQISTDFGCVPTDPAGFVGKFYGIGLSLIGGVAVLFIIYGGYLYLTSQGNQIAVDKAKQYITYAIIGLLFAVFGFVFMQLVAVDVLHIPGFK